MAGEDKSGEVMEGALRQFSAPQSQVSEGLNHSTERRRTQDSQNLGEDLHRYEQTRS